MGEESIGAGITGWNDLQLERFHGEVIRSWNESQFGTTRSWNNSQRLGPDAIRLKGNRRLGVAGVREDGFETKRLMNRSRIREHHPDAVVTRNTREKDENTGPHADPGVNRSFESR